MLRETEKSLQASVTMLNVKIHDSKIRKTEQVWLCLQGLPGKNHLTLKGTWQHVLD